MLCGKDQERVVEPGLIERGEGGLVELAQSQVTDDGDRGVLGSGCSEKGWRPGRPVRLLTIPGADGTDGPRTGRAGGGAKT
jgi:hypothetical protein